MPLNHSRMTDEWIASVVRANPIRIAEKTGNIITCPVRLQWVWLTKPNISDDESGQAKKPSYEACLCFPPGAEAGIENILKPMHLAEERKHFPRNFAPDGTSFGLKSPFRDQKERMRNRKGEEVMGFTPGYICLTAKSQIKPQIVDTTGNELPKVTDKETGDMIYDPKRVYSGVWAIVALNLYKYSNKLIGVNFGLQNVMIFADDTRCAGSGGAPPKDDFAGVNIDHAYNPSAAFGNTPAAPPATAPSILPPSQPVWAPPPVTGTEGLW
jgi:hypothetical protein